MLTYPLEQPFAIVKHFDGRYIHIWATFNRFSFNKGSNIMQQSKAYALDKFHLNCYLSAMFAINCYVAAVDGHNT